MAYKHESFDGVALPQLSAKHDIGTGAANTNHVQLAAGEVYDPLGLMQARRKFRTFQVAGSLVGTPAEVNAGYNALLAKYGVKGQLWRRGVGAGVDQLHWTYARLIQVAAEATYRTAFVCPVTLTFEQWSPLWYGSSHGAGWTFDSGVFFDTGRTFDDGSGSFTLGTAPLATSGSSITLINNGHAYVTNAVIQVVAGNAALTSLTIENLTAGATTGWVWTGTLAATKTLQATCSIKRITNDGAAAFSGWSRTGTNTIVDWLRLLPGSNTIRVSWTGGGTAPKPTLLIAFSDGYN